MKDSLISFLKYYKKKTITLDVLEQAFSSTAKSYGQFADAVLECERDGTLQMVASKGRNGKSPSLAFQYRIQLSKLNDTYHDQLREARLSLHPLIKLDAYYSLDPEVWQSDKPYLEKINTYLNAHPLPEDAVPAPERSFELVGDEKWITDKHGKECLERIGLWDRLLIFPVSDPLMLAVNPGQMDKDIHLHLIVENKTTYLALLDALPNTRFTSLMFGSGKKIIKSLEHFGKQLPLGHKEHRFFYFGDLDHEGITIWHLLNEKFGDIELALPFYQACLKKPSVHGKDYQRPNKAAFDAFSPHFQLEERKLLEAMFKQKSYLPQEVLKTRELQQLWINSEWM